MQKKKEKLVSVIVTTKNEQAVLTRLLESILNQTYSNIETIVVDNSSSDKTKKIARKYTESVFNKGPERSAQRNFGASKAKGEFLFFLDADMELTPQVIKSCVESISRTQKCGAVEISEFPIAQNFWEKVKAFERSLYNLKGDYVTDAARFFKKDAFLKVGGYDETITGPEDWDLPEALKKAGFKIARVKPKINHYERIPSLSSLLRKKYYYGLKSHRYLSKNQHSIFSPKTIYFLRPVYYQNYPTLLKNPVLSFGMFFMLTCEQFSGGVGYIVGKVRGL